jgi:hypothetical protein
MIEIVHNFRPEKFKWLWTKYVTGRNDLHHCTNSIRGRYSKKLTRLNRDFSQTLVLDEMPVNSYSAIYVCGVSAAGYAQHKNYPHNVHLPIEPLPAHEDHWAFEDWTVTIRNGRILPIPSEHEIPLRYRALPPEFTTCRIFRWAVTAQLPSKR